MLEDRPQIRYGYQQIVNVLCLQAGRGELNAEETKPPAAESFEETIPQVESPLLSVERRDRLSS